MRHKPYFGLNTESNTVEDCKNRGIGSDAGINAGYDDLPLGEHNVFIGRYEMTYDYNTACITGDIDNSLTVDGNLYADSIISGSKISGYVKCEYCGRRNKYEEDLCKSCGAVLNHER